MSSQYNLHEAIASVLDTTSLTDPRDIAAKVAENIPPRHTRSVLAEVLPSYVSDQMRHRRNAALDASPVSPPGSRSSKVAAFRDVVAPSILRERLAVEGGWKMLGECTYEDLMFAAERRRELAERSYARADWYAAIAEKLKLRGVVRVSELPLHEVEAAA